MDALLKKNFWVVVIALGAIATWFFAAGLTQLIAGKWLPLEPQALASGGGARPAGGLPMAIAPRTLTARTILENNPFDSVTGPILDAPVVADVTPVATNDSGEQMFPPCSSGPKLEITVVDPIKPAKSFAVLSTGEGMANKPLVREGSTVAGREVAVIVREKLYFKEGASYCYVGMFLPPQPVTAAPTPAAPVLVDPGGPGAPGKVPSDIEKGIQKVDDHTFNIDRNVVDKIIENQAELMKSARIIPEQENGKVVGIRMLNIRPETLLGKLGLQTGDMLKTINGFDMTSPEKALEAYAKLRTAPAIQVGVVRNGKPMNIEFNIK
jgi:general secretion pathway protein C